MKSFAALLLLLATPLAQSFSTSSMAIRRGRALPAAVALDMEDDYRYTLAKARELAYNDNGSVEEAKEFLNQILEFEAECVGGSLVGEDICNNVDEVADTVSHLREKIDMNRVEARPVSPIAGVPVTLLFLFGAFVVATTMEFGRQEAAPFTFDEWVWAVKGGYLPTMVHHYMQNGGL